MSIYLQDIPLNDAIRKFNDELSKAGKYGTLGIDEISLNANVVGRVLAKPVWAKMSSPHYHAAAMDGFAIRSIDTIDAMPTRPIDLKIGIQAAYVDTGDPLPTWADAVIPIELTEPIDECNQVSPEIRQPCAIRIRAGLTPWSSVRPLGEDIIASQLVLPAGKVLLPVDLGAIAACGMASIAVNRKPTVVVIPTGNELVIIGDEVGPGDIIEYNSVVLAAQIITWGGIPKIYPITPDKIESIREAIENAAEEADLILVNAGSSAGSEDFTSTVVNDIGKLIVHGIAIRPGHPVILGMIPNRNKMKVPIIGVPGYPVSAALTGEIFVKPLLELWSGIDPSEPQQIEAILTRKITSPAGDDDYVRVVAGKVGDRVLAAPLTRGAGVITSLSRADGIIIVPRGTQGLESGSRVNVRLIQKRADLDRTIMVIGSHDMTLDLLAQYLSRMGRRLVSANVGSQGGLVAIKKDETHLAGCHLLDSVLGEYNKAAVQQYLPDTPVRLVAWVKRNQGLIVAKGNPLNILSLHDLCRQDVRYMNRQRGSGTRILLDFHLKKIGISSLDISGYDQEEFTHLGVAAAVASGRAHCGLAVEAAAVALGLNFIPLYHERYDLVIPLKYFDSVLLKPIFELMHSDEFRKDVASLPGYDISIMGDIIQ